MIKVNLLQGYSPAVESIGIESSSDNAELRKAGILRLVLVLIGPLILYVIESQTIPALRARANGLSQQLAELSSQNQSAGNLVNEIKSFQENEKVMLQRIAFLDRISESRKRAILVLDYMQQNLPEKAWLTGIDFRENEVIFEGRSLSDSENLAFMEALQKSAHMDTVELIKVEEKIEDGISLKEFVIGCRLRGGTDE
ncbi:MAG: PilN domain-containing protein [Bdellovibrionaceae bacterium]|nr:PilN domain-containing protein [Pseudobdellovibrionaceae bacterium]